MSYHIETLREIIVSAARDELLSRFTKVSREQKADGSFITEADLATQHRVADQLQSHWPDTLFLGEEMRAEEQQQLLASDQPIWCLDPLDGTSNFSADIPFYSVSLALLQHGQVQLGVVYDPNRDEFFAARKGEGATLNGVSLNLTDSGVPLKQATGLIDFKRLPAELASRLVTQMPYVSQRSFGSVALDWCWLAAGRCHIYLHGKQNIWDYAAGNLIFHEAGGQSTTLQGGSVFVNALQARSAVAAIDHNLFKEWCEWLEIETA